MRFVCLLHSSAKKISIFTTVCIKWLLGKHFRLLSYFCRSTVYSRRKVKFQRLQPLPKNWARSSCVRSSASRTIFEPCSWWTWSLWTSGHWLTSTRSWQQASSTTVTTRPQLWHHQVISLSRIFILLLQHLQDNWVFCCSHWEKSSRVVVSRN